MIHAQGKSSKLRSINEDGVVSQALDDPWDERVMSITASINLSIQLSNSLPKMVDEFPIYYVEEFRWWFVYDEMLDGFVWR